VNVRSSLESVELTECAPILRVTARVVPREGWASVVRVFGEIDISTAPRLWAGLDVALEDRRPVVLDLEQVSFMDAAAIPIVLAALRRSAELGTSFTVRRPSRAALRILEITGVVDLLVIDSESVPR
jgi:anti-sigma B factor antagonist/stage II sporulation protein AA (anti-sigma F factor antagonist)